MSAMKINPVKRLEGEIRLKGDKSISHRAVMAASIAEGKTSIRNFLNGEDCLYTLRAFRQLGIDIKISKDELIVEGKGLRGLRGPGGAIYLGNSGTSMRIMAGILAGQNFECTLTGDPSLSRRPMYRIIEPLRLMGADIKGSEDRYAPLVIKGRALNAIEYKTKAASAQVKSAVIFAGLYAAGITKVREPVRSRDHTERILSLFGAKMEIRGLEVSVYGNPRLRGLALTIPGDISGASFFIVGALLLKGSQIIIKDLLFNKTRTGLLYMLKAMGGDIKIENRRFNGYEDICDLVVRSSRLTGITISENEIPSVIDELPVLMVAAVFAQGDTHIKGAGELRVKETDRITSMTTSLKNMGAELSVKGDDIVIKGTGVLRSADLDSFEDHRTAMSLVIASLCTKGGSSIRNIECIDTSFPGFFRLLKCISVKN